MPTTLQSPKGTRCIRCATLIRNSRQRCPSCDLDLMASVPQKGGSGVNAKAASGVGAAVGAAAAKPRAAKVGMKLCPACMNSVAESEMSEANGQTVCNDCAVKLRSKAARGPATPGAPGIATPAAVTQIEAAPAPQPGGLPARPVMGEGELLTAKGMQRQLMDKLLWTRIFVMIWGFLLLTLGGCQFASGALVSGLTNMAEDANLDGNIEKMMREDEEFKQLSSAEQEKQIQEMRDSTRTARESAKSEAMNFKIKGGSMIFVAICFIVGFFLMPTKPYETSIALLILYVISEILIAVSAGEPPDLLTIVIIISIVGSLAAAVRLGYRIKDIRERAEAATGKPVIG